MLFRLACLVAALEGAAVAAPDKAAPVATCPAIKAPTAAHPIVLTVKDNLFSATPGDFPAVSADGDKLAMLFDDAEDFSAAPVHTLVIWNKAGKELVRMTSRTDPVDPDVKAPPPDGALLYRLDKANRALAGTWRSIGMAVSCSDGSLSIGDGVTFRFDEAKQTLIGAHGPIKQAFGSPGDRSEPPDHGGCGSVTRLAYGFGSKAFGSVVLVPSANLGGDSCVGKLGVDQAIVVPAR